MGIPSRLERTVSSIRKFAERDPRIVAVYVFGSRVESTATEESDLDLGVLFTSAPSLKDRVRLQAGLSEASGEAVDLVDLGSCNAFLALAAIRGERLYCSNPDLGDEFELYVLRRAADLEPFECERRRLLLLPEAGGSNASAGAHDS